MSAHEPVAVIPALYDFIRWTMPKVAALPRAHRFMLGDHLFTTLLAELNAISDIQFLRRVRCSVVLQRVGMSHGCGTEQTTPQSGEL